MKKIAGTTLPNRPESPLYDDVRNAEWLVSSLGLMSGPLAEEVVLVEETCHYPDGRVRSRREVKMTLPSAEMLRTVLPNPK